MFKINLINSSITESLNKKYEIFFPFSISKIPRPGFIEVSLELVGSYVSCGFFVSRLLREYVSILVTITSL